MDNVVTLRPTGPGAAATPPSKKRGVRPGRQPWVGFPGGWIHVAQDLTLSFYAERKVQGERFGPVMLGHHPDLAEKNYKEWWPNPRAWNPAGAVPAEGVRLTRELVQAYADFCAAPRPGTKRKRNRDADWIRQKVNRLAWWTEKFDGRNLRNDGSPGCVTKDVIESILAQDPTDYRHRLITIRAFYSFLRTASAEYVPAAKRVLIQHDPAKDIPIPGADPAQAVKGSKVAWTKKDSDDVIAWLEKYESGAGQGGTAAPRVRAPDAKDVFTSDEAAEHLGLTVATVRAYASRGILQHEGGGQGASSDPAEVGHGGPTTLVFRRKHLERFERERQRGARDTPHRVALALIVLGGTGAHAREIARLSRSGSVGDIVLELPRDHRRQNGAAKALVFEHKTGKEHAVAVSVRTAEAASELVRLGGVAYGAIFKWTKKAVDATGAARFTPGRFRHRGATMQVNRGVAKKDVAAGLGHENPKTTSIYTVKAVAPKQPTWY